MADSVEKNVLVVLPAEFGGGEGEDTLALGGVNGVPVGKGGTDGLGQEDGVEAVECGERRRHEGADAVVMHHAMYLGEVGGEHGHMALGKVGYAVGKRIVVVETEVFEKGDA